MQDCMHTVCLVLSFTRVLVPTALTMSDRVASPAQGHGIIVNAWAPIKQPCSIWFIKIRNSAWNYYMITICKAVYKAKNMDLDIIYS